jgi:hypothetical protein
MPVMCSRVEAERPSRRKDRHGGTSDGMYVPMPSGIELLVLSCILLSMNAEGKNRLTLLSVISISSKDGVDDADDDDD